LSFDRLGCCIIDEQHDLAFCATALRLTEKGMAPGFASVFVGSLS